MMFVDTSAIVAILCGEPDAAELAGASRRFTSDSRRGSSAAGANRSTRK